MRPVEHASFPHSGPLFRTPLPLGLVLTAGHRALLLIQELPAVLRTCNPHSPLTLPSLYAILPPTPPSLAAQVFHIRKNKWLKRVDVPAGPIRIDDFSQCLTLEGLPVIFPGILAKKQAPLRYIPWSNSFRRMAPLLVPRYKFVGGEMGGRLYVAGGMREQALEGDVDKKDLRSAEVYNPATRMWQALPDMHFLRYGAVGGCSERRLFVIGGTRSHLQVREDATRPPWNEKVHRAPDSEH